MIKVKEFLDDNFICNGSTSQLKSNGHYCVMGDWVYHRVDLLTEGKSVCVKENHNLYSQFLYGMDPMSIVRVDFKIRCSCNNETLRIDVIGNGKYLMGPYGYFQTYQHIPRGEADEYGYYARSTDEEIIKYISSFLNVRKRDQKLSYLLDDTIYRK